jgi:ATP-dependent helicase/nuclease subunit A
MADGRAPSTEQIEVIEATEPRLVVTASAGSGKTFVLVERYLRHVREEELRPDEILTITFTKKAAAEMKRRIVDSLRLDGRLEAAQIAETGPIQTIHSFCERLLRENCLEAGLDPAFEIMPESQAARLEIACVREALASDLEEEPHAAELLAFLAGQRRGRDAVSPYASLEEAVRQVLKELRGSPTPEEEHRARHRDPGALAAFWEAELKAALPDEAQALVSEGDAPLRERLREACRAAGKPLPSFLSASTDPASDEESRVHACGLVQLACAAWWRLRREMTRLQSLDFTELEARAVAVLRESEATCRRLRRQYRVAMVDEAQDLNPIQYELLRLLGVEREMLVGDAQQSIYGFRQADVDLFRGRTQAEEARRLSRNFRSREGILRFVDLVFGRIWGEAYAPMAAPAEFDLDADDVDDYGGVELWRQAARDRAATAGHVRELVEEGVRPADVAVLVRDNWVAVELKAALEAQGLQARIAGGSERFYARLEVRDLANALRAVADPYDDFALLSCLRSPICGLSLDAIVLLGRDGPVVERLPEFESPVPDDRPKLRRFLEWYEPLRQYADRLSAWEVLAELFARSGVLEALARRPQPDGALANVRKLLALAAAEPELGPLEYAERIREVQEIRHREGDAPVHAEEDEAVTLMTVHKAKGLEFPVVVLPQTDKKLEGKTSELLVDPRRGLVATSFGRGQGLMHRYLDWVRKARAKEEELRVLYVAMTRAKARLCICLYEANDNSASRIIGKTVGEGALPGVRVRDSRRPDPAPV